MSSIIRNRARCKKCNDTIESVHRHHFVSCRCGAIAVDGGRDYLRRLGEFADLEELSETLDSPSGQAKVDE